MAQKLLVKVDKGHWEEQQTRTYTRWANRYLHANDITIDDLCEASKDGVAICELLQDITGLKLPKWSKKPKLEIQKSENLQQALTFLKDQGVRLVNIGAEDLLKGDRKLVLALFWCLILRWQINEALHGHAAGAEDPCANQSDETPKQLLLQWVNEQIGVYGVEPAKNFSRAWMDGRNLFALVDSLSPGLLEMSEMKNDPHADIALALNVAEKYLDIPRLVDVGDIVDGPDEHSMMTYVSYFRDFNNEGSIARRKAVDMEELAVLQSDLDKADNEAEEELAREKKAQEDKAAYAEEMRLLHEQAEEMTQAKELARLAFERETAAEKAAKELARLEEERARMEAETQRLRQQAEQEEAEQLRLLEEERIRQEEAEAQRKEEERVRKERQEAKRIEDEALMAAMDAAARKAEEERLAQEAKEEEERFQEAAEKARLAEEARLRALEEAEEARLLAAAEAERLRLKQEEEREKAEAAAKAEIERLKTEQAARMKKDVKERSGPTQCDDLRWEMPDGLRIISPNGQVDLGVLKLNIWYDTGKQQLFVAIFEARCLPPMDPNGLADPYVKMLVLPDDSKKTKQKTVIRRKTLNPVYNESFVTSLSEAQCEKGTLLIKCIDWDFGQANDFIGEVRIPLQTIFKDVPSSEVQKTIGWYALQPDGNAKNVLRSGSVQIEGKIYKYADGSMGTADGNFQLPDDTVRKSFAARKGGRKINVFAPLPSGGKYLKDGTVLLHDGSVLLPSGALTRGDGKLMLRDGTVRKPVVPFPFPPLPHGARQQEDLHFVMEDGLIVHEPAESLACLRLGCLKVGIRYYSPRKKLIVNLYEGRGLPAMDMNGKSDPYVIMRLIDSSTGLVVDAHQTAIVPKTLSPEWNTNFGFAVGKRLLRNKILEFEVWDWDYGQSDDFIGRCTVDVAHCPVDKQEKAPGVISWHALQPDDNTEIKKLIKKVDGQTPKKGKGGVGGRLGIKRRSVLPPAPLAK